MFLLSCARILCFHADLKKIYYMCLCQIKQGFYFLQSTNVLLFCLVGTYIIVN